MTFSNLCARQYVLSELTDIELDALHSMERSLGYPQVPFWIHTKFNTTPHGDVSPANASVLDSRCWGVYHNIRREKLKLGALTSELEVLHESDREIRSRGWTFRDNQGSNLVDRIKKSRQKVANLPLKLKTEVEND